MKRGSVILQFLVAAALLAVIASRIWRSDWKHIVGSKPRAEPDAGLSHSAEEAAAEDARFDNSIELADRLGKVQNGSAYDRTSIDLDDADKVVLPEDAVIRRTTGTGKVQLFMKKTMAFYSRLSEPRSIRDVRKSMGCAVKREKDAVVIASFGEWDSPSEGSTSMRILAIVPLKTVLEVRKGLSGPGSVAKGENQHGPTPLAQGWTALPDVPDLDLVAKYRR